MDAGHFTTLAKGPSLQGKNSRNGTFAPGGPRKSFVIAGTETAHKGAVQVEQGTREW